MARNKIKIFLMTLLIALAVNVLLFAESFDHGIMRYPDIHDSLVAFTYGGDIWTVSAKGGIAERITINDGEELYPRFSPDGKMIAFTGEYDGNNDVYVMNIYGGDIKRLTYHPFSDYVVGWHPLKNKIIFRSARKGGYEYERLYMIDPDGRNLEDIPIHEIFSGCFSPDGSKIAYVLSGIAEATWKKYYGGMAEDILLYDLVTKTLTKLTDYKGSDRFPMWIDDKIYFNSDRDGRLNLYSCNLLDKSIVQITHHDNFDVRMPEMGGDKIVYELGGTLWLLDTGTGRTKQIPITIKTDLPERRPRFDKVSKFVSGIGCSPSGDRALLVARGEIFIVPEEDGQTVNLTNSTGAREKDAVWSPDGKWIAYQSDESGEWNIYIKEPSENAVPVRLTSFDKGYRHTLKWSPDSKSIGFTDETLTLYYLNIDTKKTTRVDKADYETMDVSYNIKEIYDYSWSPDSRYIAYSKMGENLMYNIYIYSLETGKSVNVSDGRYHDFCPVFTKDGKRLLFISNRLFMPTFCDYEWEMVFSKNAGIFALTLQKDGQPLFPPEGMKKDKPDDDNDESMASVDIVIDFDNIAGRVEMFPLEKGNYRGLNVSDSRVFYMNADEGCFNFFEFVDPVPMDLYSFDLEEKEESSIIKGINAYRLSDDGAKIVYYQGGNVGIIESGASNSSGNSLSLADLKMHLDPVAEWHQIFNDAWRMERDFYYDPNMHGLDWKAVGDKYRPLIDYAANRQDVEYILGELIGELSTSHTYISPGEHHRTAEKVNVGMLGADYEVDKNANRYRIKRIYREPSWNQDIVSPLAAVGVNVREGDYLLTVDGAEITADSSIFSYFQDMAGKEVTLLVNSKPTTAGAREVVVETFTGEWPLRYANWVEDNRRTVDSLSGGLVGYIHFPDTYIGSAEVFPQQYYPQTRKKGLVIDGRNNAGGLDPDIFFNRLKKDVICYWTRRHSHDQTTPVIVSRAHYVCITNYRAGSGGDQLPHDFKALGLGPVIGTRTWGGLVGISTFYGLVDNGTVTIPDYRVYDTDGKWMIENEGFEPDIIVELNPAEMERGYDAQLHKAVEMLLEEIKKDPRPWPVHEPFPVLR